MSAPLWGCELAKRQNLEADFIAACEAGNTPRVREMLVQDGSLVRAELRSGKGGVRQRPLNVTPLMHAARAGKLDVVRALLEAGASAEAKTRSGRTALHEARDAGHQEVVKALEAAGR